MAGIWTGPQPSWPPGFSGGDSFFFFFVDELNPNESAMIGNYSLSYLCLSDGHPATLKVQRIILHLEFVELLSGL